MSKVDAASTASPCQIVDMASVCAYTCACCRDRDDRQRGPRRPASPAGATPRSTSSTASTARVLPVYRKDGQAWVVGTPGREYSVRIRSINGGRLLAVTSVDGVNVISGETASPAQSGYVLDPYSSLDIAGWRKNLARTAAFYFTELPDSYAARTGRPDHVGVIGVAVFRERVAPVPGKIGQSRANEADGAGGPAAYPSASAPRRDAATGEATARDAAGSVVAEQKAQEAVAPELRGRLEADRQVAAAPLYAPAPAPRRRPSSAPGTAATRLRTRRWWRSSATARSRRR